MLDEDRGVGPPRVGLDVHDLLGGDAAAPVAYGIGDRAGQLVEGGGGGGGVVEVSDGCVHGGTLTAAHGTAGTETASIHCAGTSP